MSRIRNLIAQTSPDGVPFRAIGDIAECSTGATPDSSVSEFWIDGTIPWMSSGEVNKGTVLATEKMITQAAYDSCSTRLLPTNSVVMALAGQGKTRGSVARTRIALCTNQSLAAILPNHEVDPDFLYYFLTTQYQKLREVSAGDGTRGGLNLKMIRAYRVPVPPMETQREVVRILDQFAESEAALEAELTAESVARRSQYAIYRDLLLTAISHRAIRRAPLHEVAAFRRGTAITAKQTSPGLVPVVANGPVSPYTHGESNRSGESIVIARSGAYAGLVSFWRTPIFLTDAFSVHPDPDVARPRYLFHWLQAQQRNLHAMKKGAGVPHIRVSDVESLETVIPPLEEQDRIVGILDELEAHISELTVDLQAELVARRSQYEYYRDKLLTFKEKVA